MKKLLLETSFSKIYIIGIILISLLIMGGYFSYAMFTVTKEKSNAISIVTGSLDYHLTVDGEETNSLSVSANSSKEFVVELSNPNDRIARFNFYYIGEEKNGVYLGYVNEKGYNITPKEEGINLEKINSSGSSNTYLIRISNYTNSSFSIELGVEVGLDYNDLSIPNNGHLFEEYAVELSTVLLADSDNNINTSDSEQSFITGEDPNNYIWYSGKLWRAVSIDPSDNSVKLVTEWNISAVSYNEENNSAFKGSHMEMWLNDETEDGFLGNLREPEKFIKMDSKWNATMTTSTSKPPKTTIVEDPVGSINLYEYTICQDFLYTGVVYYLITPYSATEITAISYRNVIHFDPQGAYFGIRPAINLKGDVRIVDGSGTEEDPYRLLGDNDTNLTGTKLNTRYSGEYIRFGVGENNLYRIVSHEITGLTKIVSSETLKEDGEYKTISFGSNNVFTNSNTIGTFLNNDYLNPSNGYLTSEQLNMIEESTTWYLGEIYNGDNYRLTKYTNEEMTNIVSKKTAAKIGLLRLGELFSTIYDSVNYFLITPFKNNTNYVFMTRRGSYINSSLVSDSLGLMPSLNLKENVIITGGTGIEKDPFIITIS